MKVIFIGNEAVNADGQPIDTNDVCRQFGKVFVKGQEVDVSDLPEAQRRKLAGNKHFRVSDEAAAPATAETEPPKPKKVKAPKVEKPDGDEDQG